MALTRRTGGGVALTRRTGGWVGGWGLALTRRAPSPICASYNEAGGQTLTPLPNATWLRALAHSFALSEPFLSHTLMIFAVKMGQNAFLTHRLGISQNTFQEAPCHLCKNAI